MGLFDLGIGGVLKGLKSFTHPEKGYEKAQDQFARYYPEAQGYLSPYNQYGHEAHGQLNTAIQSLMNPTDLYDQFLNNYHQSDASKYAQGRAQQSGLNALSSMGLLGSTPGLQAIQAGTNQIAAEDEERFIERMINQYLQGAGLAQGIFGQGASAANQLGQNATNMGQNQAEMAYGKQNAPGQLFGGLLKAGLGASGGGGGGWSTGG